MSYDVIVVGAGPAGSVAARECAKLGMKTFVIDRRQEIGAPVRCGEGLSEAWMKRVGLDYDPAWCLQETNGVILYTPSEREVRMQTHEKGYVIERKMFEKKLAAAAIEAGAQYLVKSRVFDVIKENNCIAGVRAETPDGKKEFRSKIVIAADGIDSMVAKYAGINTVNPLCEVDSGYEYEMANINIREPNMVRLYLGNEVAPRGYIWIFPKSKTTANVGVGILVTGEKTAKYYLDKFIKAHPAIFRAASALEIKGGCVPVGEPLKKPYAAGLLIVGDAAHMVNPIHGGGMGIAMEAGALAAKHAKAAIDSTDLSEEKLSAYAAEWFEIRGKKLLQVLKVRKFFEKLSDQDMETIASVVTPELLLDLTAGKKFGAFAKLFIRNPKLAMLAARTLG